MILKIKKIEERNTDNLIPIKVNYSSEIRFYNYVVIEIVKNLWCIETTLKEILHFIVKSFYIWKLKLIAKFNNIKYNIWENEL